MFYGVAQHPFGGRAVAWSPPVDSSAAGASSFFYSSTFISFAMYGIGYSDRCL